MSSSKSAKTPVPAQKNTLFGWVKKSTPDAPGASAAQAPVAAPSNTVPATAAQPSPTSDVVTASSLSLSAGGIAKLESPPAVPVHPSSASPEQSAPVSTSNESTLSMSSKPAAAQSVAVHSSATAVAAAVSSAMDEDDDDDGPISLGALKAKRASLLSNAANQSVISSTSTTGATTPAQSTASVFFGSGKASAGTSVPSNTSSSAPPHKRSRKATPTGKEKEEEEDDEDASIPDDEDEDDDDNMDEDEDDDDDGFVRRKKGGSGSGKGGSGQRKAKGASGAGARPSKGGKKATSATAVADSGTKRKREEDAPAVDGDDGGAEGGEAGEGSDAAVGGVYPAGKHSHDAIPWIKAEGIRDAQGRRPDHADYDYRTLLVPKDFFKATKVTPAQQQWWLMKAQYADTVLFFKQGKFYELFHQDADVGVAHGGLTYMRGESAHCGFPEICYGAVSAALVSKGYRVARVEQVETPEAAKVRQDYMRSKAKGGRGGLDEADKVVRRELCGIKSKGTRTAGVLDVFAGATAMRAAAALRGGGGDTEGTLPSSIVDAAYGDTSGLVTAMGGQGDKATALYSIKEVPLTPPSSPSAPTPSASQQSLDAAGAASAAPVLLAVAIVDCMAGEIILAQWVDDSHRSRLRTLLSRVPAAEVVYESGAGGCSAWTKRVLGYDAPAALHTPMRPGVDYWTAAHTAGELSLAHYSSLLQEAYADPAPKLEEPAVLDQQSTPRVLLAGTESKASYMQVRNRDYFLAKEEGSAPSTVPPVGEAGPAMVTNQGPDGKDRTMPAVLAELMERSASLGHSLDADVQAALSSLPSPTSPLAADVPLGPTALSALGAAVHVLRRHLLDHAVLSMRRMYRYTHADGIEGALALLQSQAELPPATGQGEGVGVPHMVLDATALAHMEVLETSDGKVKGSLIGLLDVCACSAGRARLRAWLSAPLLQPEDIEDRLNAVENIMAVTGRAVDAQSPFFLTAQGIVSSSDPIPGSSLHSDIKKALSGLPDLDRLLARIHTLGSKVAAKDHPDARAIMYENDTYSKRRIGDIVAALTAFRAVAKVRDLFHQRSTGGGTGDVQPWVKAPMLMRCTHSNFPDLRPILSWFDSTYDLSAISKTGKVEPVAGQDAVFDQACAEIQSVQKELKAFERQARIDYSCSGIAYGNEDVNNKDPYLLEVPAQAKDDVPEDWRLVGQRKAGKVPVMKYVAPEVEEMVKRLEAATEKKKEASRDALRKMFSRFDSFSSLWQTAASAIATLDCIFALAVWSGAGDGGAMCRPKVLPMNDASAPFLHTSGARHPTLSIGLGSSAGSSLGPASFIPNDITLGKGQPSMCLLTGPNMGGKSTYLRTACTAVLLSQLGCYVPASSCTLTPVDRIFTRVGAHDRILAGQSTFYVELAETGVILGQASKHSLVILDELGRGTSTFDGAAIAYAVTRHLVDTIQARTLFATHYHTLCDDFAENEKVALGHMRCLTTPREDGTADVVFLYKYGPGACPASHGLNVARLARLPESVITRARQQASKFEEAVQRAQGKGEGTGRGRIVEDEEQEFTEEDIAKIWADACSR